MSEAEFSPKFAPFFGMVGDQLDDLKSGADRYIKGGIAFAVSFRWPYY